MQGEASRYQRLEVGPLGPPQTQSYQDSFSLGTKQCPEYPLFPLPQISLIPSIAPKPSFIPFLPGLGS